MDSCSQIKFNYIFRDLFPEKNSITPSKHDESRFVSLFRDLEEEERIQSSFSFSSKKTSDRSPSPSSVKEASTSSSSQWSLDFRKILLKEDTRTTLMIKNIPNKFSREKLLNIINEKFKDCYDIYVLSTDSNGTKNFGYGFINLKSYLYVIPFYQEFHGNKWAYTKSEKVCEISYSKIQGKDRLVNHYPPKHIFINKPYSEVNRVAPLRQLNCVNGYSNTFLSSIAYNNERFFIYNQSTPQIC